MPVQCNPEAVGVKQQTGDEKDRHTALVGNATDSYSPGDSQQRQGN